MPATNGSSTSFRSHSSAMKTRSAQLQKISWRRSDTWVAGSGGGAEAGPVLIMLMMRSVSAVPALPRHAIGAEMADPFRDIVADRKQGQYGDNPHHYIQAPASVEFEAERAQGQARQHDLGNGIELRD